MEPPLKRTAAAPVRHRSKFDDLPDHVVHNILNFVTLKDIARYSTLSRRWRKLCTSLPNLNISCTETEYSITKRSPFLDFIDRLMFHRNGLKIQSFGLVWKFLQHSLGSVINEEGRVELWLHEVERCNVENLDLRIAFAERDRSFSLPCCFSSCRSLRSIRINLLSNILVLPTRGFDFLQVLNLHYVRLELELFGEWVSSCKSLRKLVVRNSDGIKGKVLNITSTSLDMLGLCNLNNGSNTILEINVSTCSLRALLFNWFSSQRKKIVVSAPRLQSLILDGEFTNEYHLGSLNSLQKAYVFAQAEHLSQNEASPSAPSLEEVFRSISGAKVLHLGIVFVKLLFRNQFPVTSLQSVHSLYLHVGPDPEDNHVPIIASFLERVPNLNYLTVRSYFQSPVADTNELTDLTKASSFSMKFWETKNLKLIGEIKSVVIELDRGHSAFEFIKYLLKHAKALEKLTIYYPPEKHSHLSKITESIEAWKKAFCVATISLLPRPALFSPQDVWMVYQPF